MFAKIDLKLDYLAKKMQNIRALWAQSPDPRASNGWGRCPQWSSVAEPTLTLSIICLLLFFSVYGTSSIFWLC